ncbi:hypothetical protein [Cognatilysobacter bugurensis]|uniref:Uncharacterized protein n=1 Tax=Cognatilysobacter bugurensis TaxID=543356 RepID=A0A918W9Y7_9GAMM|nr:hypothetical protein [Lysobacter bugurensis]GHA87157.1 hypothetical protein GCM10007067_26270 [Lysobacter bugurensis]
MPAAADSLHPAARRIDSLLDEAVQRAGQGVDPQLARRLDTAAHQLCDAFAAVHAALVDAVRDTVELARRVMDAADPEAPLLMLRLAREQLMRALRRADRTDNQATAEA